MIVEIDDKSGFCFGVVNAIDKAERELIVSGYINSLGDIVHNRVEMARLKRMGLRTITHADISNLDGKTLFIRAHGEPPSTYNMAHEAGLLIVDATCPVVSRLQKEVKDAYVAMCAVNGQVVILGKRGHAEVVGLTGQINNNAIIVQSVDDMLQMVDFNRPIYLLSQTTQPLSLFLQLKDIIEQRVDKAELGIKYIIKDTICRNVSNREPHLRAFSTKFDVVLFVAGKDSSNGKALYEVCRSVNSRCYAIEDEADIDAKWLEGIDSIGICGATSTPKWLMERIGDYLKEQQ